MNNFKVGVNFDFDLLDKINELNQKNKNGKVTELYGSTAEWSSLAARPTFRLPDIDNITLRKYVDKVNSYGIDFNYTLNSFIPYGSKLECHRHINDIVNYILFLQSIGVRRVTVTNPMLIEIIRKNANSDIDIEISTCAHIDTITQIKYYHEKYGVNKICGNLNKNRDFKFLEAASEYCKNNGIIYELMANEFCGVGGKGYATHCIYRDSCYVCHATNETYDDSMLLNNYPMELCTCSRNEDPSNWLRLKWIRPEDLKHYNNIGINNFKITGRTGSSEYIIKTIEAYLNESFDGNLIELWKPLESIKPGVKESDVNLVFIDNKKLDGFLYPWLNGKLCDNEVCGETCKYCSNYYDLIKNEEV